MARVTSEGGSKEKSNSCCQCMTSEFQLSNFGFGYKDWRAFTYSPWLPQKWQVQWLFLIYRWSVAINFTYYVYLSVMKSWDSGKAMVTHKHWCNFFFIAYLDVAAVSVTYKFVKMNFGSTPSKESTTINNDDDDDSLQASGCCNNDPGINWFQMVQWALFTVAGGSVLVGVSLYWTFVYEPGKKTSEFEGVNLNTHLLNAVFAVIDIWISGTPIRIYHVVYLQLYGIAYFSMTIMYYMAGGTDHSGNRAIYPPLDYGQTPGIAAVAILVTLFIFFPLVHLKFYTMSKLRDGIINILTSCKKKENGTEYEMVPFEEKRPRSG